MEGRLLKDFELPSKNASEEALRRWRNAVGLIIRNRRRRLRYVADLEKRSHDARSLQVPSILSPPLPIFFLSKYQHRLVHYFYQFFEKKNFD